MGANAQTSVPAFTAGQVLTAQQQTEINTGVPVFADSTARDAAFGGAGEKVLAEGQLAYLEDSNVVQYYDGSSWATLAPTLTLVKTQTIGTTVASVTVTDAFSATYDAYKITLAGGTGSVNDELLALTLGATTTGYYASYSGTTYSTNAASLISNNNAASWTRAGTILTDGLHMNVDLVGPNLAKRTFITGGQVSNAQARPFAGYLNDTTAYTAFTLTASSGTLTGGVIRVYGYANS